MVAAAAETVGAPDLADIEPDFEPVGEAVEKARDVARRRVILAAEAVLLAGGSACLASAAPRTARARAFNRILRPTRSCCR